MQVQMAGKSQEYKVINPTFKGTRKMYPITKDPYEVIGDKINTPWYESIYIYKQEHYEQLQEQETLAGITGLTTDKLVWDLDDGTDLNQARADAITLCTRLTETYEIPEDNIHIAFSGKKGFSVVVFLDERISREQFQNLNLEVAKGLNTNDTKIFDPNRIFRILGTKHNSSDCYKCPLTLDQLMSMDATEIVAFATDIDNIDTSLIAEYVNPTRVVLPASLLKVKDVKPKTPVKETSPLDLYDLDFKTKPKGFSNCKFAILNGLYTSGNRNNALMALAATCRAQGFPKETAFNICTASIGYQAQRYNQEPFSEGELRRNIIDVVYNPTWQGGQYSCKTTPWLTELCQGLGKYKCTHEEHDNLFIEMDKISTNFNLFATEFEKNKITTGIEELDEKVTLCTSMLVGLLANPGTGKTTLALNILNHTNKNNISTIFYSMDMGIPLVYLRMIQKHFSIPMEKVIEIYKTNPAKVKEFNEVLAKEYSNVKFSFKAGLTVEEIRQGIIEQEKLTGQKVKFVVVDYLECIAGPYSDATANTAIIANKLKDVANETETCILLLLQTQKHGGQPDEPLLSMKNIKGSSVIEQACSVVLTIWREGYNPKYTDHDKFISIATVKNRLNTLWKQDFHWTGINGTIRELMEEEAQELAELREAKKHDKEMEAAATSW